jgi:hypothetical protein
VSCHGITTSYVGSSVSMHISGALIRVNVHLKLNGSSFAPSRNPRSLTIRISWLLGWTSRNRSSKTPSTAQRRPPDSWISGRKYLWRYLIASARNEEETVSHILHRNCCNKSCSVCSQCCYYLCIAVWNISLNGADVSPVSEIARLLYWYWWWQRIKKMRRWRALQWHDVRN